MWLFRFHFSDTLVNFDPLTGKYEIVDLSSLNYAPKTEGSCETSAGTFMALYPFNGQIMFRINDKTFTLDEQTIVNVTGPDERRILKIIRDGHQIAIHEYVVTAERFEDDPTPMIDDEDFDFGLLISNISKDAQRKEILLGRKDI